MRISSYLSVLSLGGKRVARKLQGPYIQDLILRARLAMVSLESE